LIAAARLEAGERVHPQFPSRFVTALEARLVRLAPQEIVDFDARRNELYKQSDRPGLRAANRLVDTTAGHLSAPSPAFFSGLLSLGRETFERALADADSLYWEPVMRAIAEGQLPADRLLLSELTAAAGHCYAKRDDGSGEFGDLVAARLWEEPDDTGLDEDTEEGPWDGDPAQVQTRLPKLSAMFAARTAAERFGAPRRPLGAFGWILVFAAVLIAAFMISLIDRASEH